jgi:hypothetical protein
LNLIRKLERGSEINAVLDGAIQTVKVVTVDRFKREVTIFTGVKTILLQANDIIPVALEEKGGK